MQQGPQKNQAADAGTKAAQDEAHRANYINPACDFLTVVKSKRRRLAKMITPKKVLGYDEAKSFTFHKVTVAGFEDLGREINKLLSCPNACVVREKPKPRADRTAPGNYPDTWAKRGENFVDVAHHWVMFDIDGYQTDSVEDPVAKPVEALHRFIEERLPQEFKGASFHWQQSGSAGTPGYEGQLKAHLWYWLASPRTTAELRSWSRSYPGVDDSVFNTVQAHYISPPVLAPGVEDPVALRSGTWHGTKDEVEMVFTDEMAQRVRKIKSGEGGKDLVLKDPRDKESLIGEFHRHFDATHVLTEFLGDHFTPGSTARRWTMNASNTPEGVWIHDDQMHVGGINNSWPTEKLGGVCNLWDLTRHFLFGHLDDEAASDDEFVDMCEGGIGRRPSDKAMYAFAAMQPEIKEARAIEVAARSNVDLPSHLSSCLVSLNGIDVDEDTTLPHFVDRWIPENEVTLLAGHGGSGKSYVSLSIGIHVALGLPFGPLSTIPAKVLFFSAEDGAPALRKRLGLLCRELKIDPAQLHDKLHLLDVSDIDPALHRRRRITRDGETVQITDTELVSKLKALVEELEVGMVIIDNASDAYDDDEINRASVRAFVRSLRIHIARPGRAVLLLAHINKASAQSSRAPRPERPTEDYSGSTAWHNSVRSRLSLVPSGTDGLVLEHMKANQGPKADPVQLEWHNGVPLVLDSFGVTSPELENARKAEEAIDRDAIVAVLRDFQKRGERVTTATQGPYSIFKLLKDHKRFPVCMGSGALNRIIRDLESEGVITRTKTQTENRKTREVFVVQDCAKSATSPPKA